MTTDLGALLLDESPDAVVAVSSQGRVLWSKGGQATFGYTRQESLGRSIEDLVVPAGAPR